MTLKLQELFNCVVSAADRHAPGDPATLHPDEALLVKRAAPKRVAEFAAGRACARAALNVLGVRDFTLLSAPDRTPRWPAGIVGSITHCDGYCAAVVARHENCLGLGIDSEGVGRAGRNIWSTIATEPELLWCASLPAQLQDAGIALIFSAKEAFYKCQYPLTEQWLNFHDLKIEVAHFDLARGVFTVHSLRGLAIDAHVRWPVSGRYVFHDSLVTTAVAIAGDGSLSGTAA